MGRSSLSNETKEKMDEGGTFVFGHVACLLRREMEATGPDSTTLLQLALRNQDLALQLC